MLPVVVIAGRPNVGKSTLFNCLTRRRDALVANEPGVTRDRIYGIADADERRILVVDTGGLTPDSENVARLVHSQAERAVEEADLVLFVVDARAGLTPDDEEVANWLRRASRPVVLVVNKIDGLDPDVAQSEFHSLGLGEPVPIAAAHRSGVHRLTEIVCSQLPEFPQTEDPESGRVRVCILGRPNVGKSTLINQAVGEERVVAHDAPGTTRDSIEVPFERNGREYLLIDTAGVRRRARVSVAVEKFSVLKSLRAVSNCDVVVLMVDAEDGIVDQDLHLLGIALEAGRSLVIAVNKWDRLRGDDRRRLEDALERALTFAAFVPRVFISALKGTGLPRLFGAIDRVWRARQTKMSTPRLTRLLQDAVTRNAPPVVKGRRVKLRYAHAGGGDPPRIIVHGNQADALPAAYRRYLVRIFRESLGLAGTPLELEFRRGANPYEGRKNPLTDRQKRRRKRIIRHSKR
ncbi:MAG TPA: ribosome biogenesis GTPase Der [Gammaproteobacteria bacterium]